MIKVIYHGGNCNDGFGSYMVAANALAPASVEGRGMVYNDPVPWDWLTAEDDVYILDFSFKRDDLLNIKTKVKSLIVLDHHETAKQNLEGLDFCKFDMLKSGVGLTWEHFNPTAKDMPWMLKYIQDRDLWKYEYDDTKAFNSGMACVPKDLDLWRAIYHDEHKLEVVLVTGVGVMKYSDMQIQHIAKNAAYSTLANEPVIMVNSATLMSELGDYLLHKPENIDKVKFAAIWCQRGDSIAFSLRSSNKTDNNCAALCQKFGGGGHKHAAGFNVSLADGLTLGKLQFNLS